MKKYNGLFLKYNFEDINFYLYDYYGTLLYKDSGEFEVIEELRNNYKNKIIWCYDLRIEGSFILKTLMKLKYKFTSNKKINNGEYSYLINGNGDWFFIKYKKNNKLVTLYNCHNKIPKIEKEDMNGILSILREFEDNGHNGITIGSDCFSEFRKGLDGKYRKYFPELDEYIDSFCRKSYYGGLCICNVKGKVENGYIYDVHSMYPYIMKNRYLPYGLPSYFSGEPNFSKNSLYICHIIADFRLKDGHIPNIIEKGDFEKNYLIEDSEGPKELYLTSIDLELFKDNYDIFSIDYLDGYLFRRKKGLFDQYINKYYDIKNNSIKGSGKYKYSKLMLNNLGGKLGTKPDGQIKELYLDDTNTLTFKKSKIEKKKTVYIPAADFMTAYARYYLIKSIEKVGLEHFRYCDTDSIHTDIKCDDILNFGEELGQFGLESSYNIGAYAGQKQYMVDNEIKYSGLSDFARKNNIINIDDFIKGIEIKDEVIVQGPAGPEFINKIFKLKGVK